MIPWMSRGAAGEILAPLSITMDSGTGVRYVQRHGAPCPYWDAN